MGSTFNSPLRVLSRGVDQSAQRHLVNPESAWYLLNMRPRRGRLEQTPWLESLTTLGAVNGESTPVNIRMIRRIAPVLSGSQVARYLVLTVNTARFLNPSGYASTYIPFVEQIVKPARATLTGECLLYGHNTTDFASDSDQIDVAINTDGSHFHWRRNGGAWSADLVIGPAVAIGANGLYVSFQGEGATTDYTNFTVGDTWSWKRNSTLPTSSLIGLSFNPPTTVSEPYANDVYIAHQRVILRYRQNTATEQAFITTVGYTKTYGNRCVVFNNHLFVAQYSTGSISTLTDQFSQATTPYTLAWSHLNNPDQFFGTLINEADSYQFNNQPYADFQGYGITNMLVWRNLLFVFLADSISTVQYIGLPTVMLIQPTNSQVGCIAPDGLVKTPAGVYFIGRNDFYVIRDYEPVAIGAKVREQVFADLFSNGGTLRTVAQYITATYNSGAKEVIWSYTYISSGGSLALVRQVVYNELTDDWYFRNMPGSLTNSGALALTAVSHQFSSAEALLYATNKAEILVEQSSTSVGTPIPDGESFSYTIPQIDTPYMPVTDAFHVKETSGLHIDASYGGNGTGIYVGVSAVSLIGDASASNSPTTITAQQWTQSLTDVRLSLPRKAYRFICYRFRFFASGGSYVKNAVFNFFQEFTTGSSNHVEK